MGEGNDRLCDIVKNSVEKDFTAVLESSLKKNCDRDIGNQTKKYTQVRTKGNTKLAYTLAQS